MERRLYRSRTDRMLGGVAGGLGAYTDLDPTIVRIAIVLLAVVSSGAIVIAYLVMWIVIPEEPHGEDGQAATGTSPPAASQEPARSWPAGKGRRRIGLILVAVGAIMLLERYIPRFDYADLWPVAIVAIGLLMMFRRGD